MVASIWRLANCCFCWLSSQDCWLPTAPGWENQTMQQGMCESSERLGVATSSSTKWTTGRTTRYHKNGRKLDVRNKTWWLVGGFNISSLLWQRRPGRPMVFARFPSISSFARTTPLELPQPSEKCGRSRANSPGSPGATAGWSFGFPRSWHVATCGYGEFAPRSVFAAKVWMPEVNGSWTNDLLDGARMCINLFVW